MTLPSWQELSSIFQQVYDLPTGERHALLDQLCPDAAVREEVESLLRAHDLAEHFTEAGFTASVGDLGSASYDLAPSRQFGPYTLLREIGQGGMSTVYLAARADDEFDRLVAIKTLRSVGGPDGYERFLAERQVHASLEHPGIARLYGGGTSDRGVPYIEMEYIDGGRPIAAYCDAESLGARARVELFRSVCDAVAYAHHNLVVHRDLKPNNILVTPGGQPKLLDFGISKLLSTEELDWDPTGIGPGPLTPGYASPEQILGEVVTTAADVYSLGVLLFRMLAGQLPFSRSLTDRVRELESEVEAPAIETVARATLAVVDEQEHPLPNRGSAEAFLDLERGQRQDLEAIVGKALRRAPGERYGAVEQLDEDLRRWLVGLPVSARLPTLTYRASRWLRRNWLVASFAAAVVLTLLVSSMILAAQKSELAVERDRARAEAAKSERILGLLLELFEGSDPGSAQGEDVSVRDVLLRAEPRIEQELATQPKVQAALLEAVGRVFLNLGNTDEAERLLSRAHDLWVSTAGAEGAEGASTLDLLSRIELRRGDFERALELLDQSQARRLETYGAESPEVAISLGQKAYVHLLFYQNELAEQTARQAVAIFDRHPAEGVELERIEARFNLAEAVNRRRGRAESQALFESLLADSRQWLGESHPRTLVILGKLAELATEHPADFELAERYAREKLEVQTRVFEGEDHPAVVVANDVLASILAQKGDLDEAEQLFEHALAMRIRLDGEKSPFMAVTLGNLGWFHLFRRNDPVAAEPLLQRALAMAEEFFSPNANLLTYPLIALGRCRTLRGAAEEGEPYLRRALAIRQGIESEGQGKIKVARVELFLGESLAAQGRCEEAEPLLRRSRALLEAGGEPDDLARLGAPLQLFDALCAGPGSGATGAKGS